MQYQVFTREQEKDKTFSFLARLWCGQQVDVEAEDGLIDDVCMVVHTRICKWRVDGGGQRTRGELLTK